MGVEDDPLRSFAQPSRIGFNGGLNPAMKRQARSVLGAELGLSPLDKRSRSSQLTAGLECAPKADEIAAAGLHHEEPPEDASQSQYHDLPRLESGKPWAPAVSFYLHESGAFDASARVACFLSAINNGSNVDWKDDNADDRVMPNVAEHLTDYWLVEHLRHNLARTMDPDAADFHVVGAALRTSWFASQLDGQECGSEVEHFQLVNRILEALRNQETFRRTGGRNYVFIDTDWNWNTIMGHRLSSLVRDHGAVLATVDTTIASFGGVQPENVLVVPYKAHYMLEAAAFGQEAHASASKPMLLASDLQAFIQQRRRERPFSFTFHGDMTTDIDKNSIGNRNVSFTFHGAMTRVREGRFRAMLRNLGAGLVNASVHDVRFGNFQTEEAAKLAQRTARTLTHSVFCFVPSGDTPSSRRLFDALAAGCVPIIFSDLSNIGNNLPFRSLIDWSQIAIFAGSLQCVSDRIGGAIEWLRTLADSSSHLAMKVELLRARGRDAFIEHLSYRSRGIADGVVNELGRIKQARSAPPPGARSRAAQ